MHVLNITTVVCLLLMVGSELSVSAFVDPSAWRLEERPQAVLLSHYAAVLGKVMPFWYGLGLLLLATETWLNRRAPGFAMLLSASVLWFLATLGSILFLVPLNNRVIAASPGWQQAHRQWDSRHRVRIVLLFVAALLFTMVIVR